MSATIMTTNDRIAIELGEDGVAEVRFTRPDKMNALDPEMFQRIIEAGSALQRMKGLRVVVLSGAGRAFCAGLDLSNFSRKPAEDEPSLTERTYGNSNRPQQVAMQWRKLPVPVIAAVHGVCFGGGLQIASGADIRVVHPETRMAIMELKWGLVPDMGGYVLWRGMVRDDVLRELIYTNREFTGAEAQALGLATYVDDNPRERALEGRVERRPIARLHGPLGDREIELGEQRAVRDGGRRGAGRARSDAGEAGGPLTAGWPCARL